jgi:dolichol-phosphate mannosyltransferase
MKKISIVIPAHNEEGNVALVHQKSKSFLRAEEL